MIIYRRVVLFVCVSGGVGGVGGGVGGGLCVCVCVFHLSASLRRPSPGLFSLSLVIGATSTHVYVPGPYVYNIYRGVVRRPIRMYIRHISVLCMHVLAVIHFRSVTVI